MGEQKKKGKRAKKKSYWERVYETGEYRRQWDSKFPSPELVGVVAASSVRFGAVALDLGCGGGREAIFLAYCGYHTIGVDVSTAALDIARRRATQAHINVDWVRGSFFDLPVKSGSVDLLNDRGALHLIAERGRPAFAAEVARVLKPGGVFLVRGVGLGNRQMHYTPITEASLERHFPRAKFHRGPLLPIAMVSDVSAIKARIAVLRRRR